MHVSPIGTSSSISSASCSGCVCCVLLSIRNCGTTNNVKERTTRHGSLRTYSHSRHSRHVCRNIWRNQMSYFIFVSSWSKYHVPYPKTVRQQHTPQVLVDLDQVKVCTLPRNSYHTHAKRNDTAAVGKNVIMHAPNGFLSTTKAYCRSNFLLTADNPCKVKVCI